MTWIGKILAVLVMILAVAWMWFTVSVYVARTNWKAQADQYKTAYGDARAAVETEQRMHAGERDALARELTAERTKSAAQETQIAKLNADSTANAATAAALDQSYKTLQRSVTELQANLQSAITEVGSGRDRNTILEAEKVRLVIARETAEKDRQAAENAAKQAQAERLLADRRVEDLSTQVNELRQTSTAGGGGLPRPGGKAAAPVPEGLRGTVTASKDGYVVVSIGIDAGLTAGASVDVYRHGDNARYLGTVVIDQVYPKQAVGLFTPAAGSRPVGRLRPEELPQVGDLVGKLGSIGASR